MLRGLRLEGLPGCKPFLPLFSEPWIMVFGFCFNQSFAQVLS